jgi:serine protease Do
VTLLRAAVLCAAVLGGTAPIAPAQSLARSPLRDSPEVHEAFRDVVRKAGRTVLHVLCDGEYVAMATVLDEDGDVVTKASELYGAVVCVDDGGRRLPARLVGIDSSSDLALLHLEAGGLRPVHWSEAGPSVGQLVVTPSVDLQPLAVGIVSVAPREIPPERGFLGVQLDDDEGGPRIRTVVASSAAEQIGLLPGDLVLGVEGQPTRTWREVVAAIRAHRVGSVVSLSVVRDGEELRFRARLGPADADPLHGVSSLVASGFPSAFQHDCVILPRECGGPLLDLEGRALGVNIARVDRTASYALPAAEVQRIVERLRADAVY